MSYEAVLDSEFHSAAELRDILEPEIGEAAVLQLRPAVRLRGAVDPAILVALATSPALTALVTGVLRMIEKRLAQPAKIRIRWPDGFELEVDARVDTKRLHDLLAARDQLEPPRISVVPK